MNKEKYVCPPNRAISLDNFIRKWLHNPVKIFGKYIREGMTIVDLGCGPGFFTVPFGEMIGSDGKVIAADLQEEMLEKVKKKIRGKKFEKNIILHLCGKEKTGIEIKADFVNAFYMVHEVPSSENLISEIYSMLNRNGIFFLTEPKGHVSKRDFDDTVKIAENIGFKIIERPKIRFGRSAVFIKV